MRPNKRNLIKVGSLTVILLGATHVLVDNDSWYHDPLQVVFSIGLVIHCLLVFRVKRESAKNAN